MTSGGSLTNVENATDYPIRLVESGPAGGVMGSGPDPIKTRHHSTTFQGLPLDDLMERQGLTT